jgi:hypothetical protein
MVFSVCTCGRHFNCSKNLALFDSLMLYCDLLKEQEDHKAYIETAEVFLSHAMVEILWIEVRADANVVHREGNNLEQPNHQTGLTMFSTRSRCSIFSMYTSIL